jgi:hypothetical protein
MLLSYGDLTLPIFKMNRKPFLNIPCLTDHPRPRYSIITHVKIGIFEIEKINRELNLN